MEGLTYDKNPSLDKSKIKITLTSWISRIRYYMEENGMDTVLFVYDIDLKTKIYLLDDWGVSNWFQILTTTGVGDGKINYLPI